MPPQGDEVESLLATIPQLQGYAAEQLSIVELGGTTNRNYRIGSPAGQFALRISREDRGGFVNRAWEVQSARLAAEAGIGAPLVYADPATGLMLTRWIEGAALTGAALRADPALLGRAARLLRTLHASHIVFPRGFDAFAIIQDYRRRLQARGRFQVRWSEQVSAALDRARHALLRTPLPPVPSHCDPFPHNFLDDGTRTVLLDWEYAGMNDPAWDLAYFALEAELAAEQVELLLAAYGDERIGALRLQWLQLTAAALGVLWSDLRDPAGEHGAMAEWARSRLQTAESLAALT